MTNQQGAPEALRLAAELEIDPSINRPSVVAELRRLHAENTALQHGHDAARLEIDSLQARVQELGAMLRENRSKRIVELEAQLEAIGAGGVEPLRRRECLHQISEPETASQPPAGWVMVPELPDERMERAIAGAFCGTVYEARKAWESGIAAAPKATPVPVVEQEELREGASYESMNLAVMVLSDCGHSSNYKPLLERVAGRIDRHVERLLTAQHADRAMRAKAAPAAVAGPSDESIEDFLASRMSAEGRIPMIRTIREALTHFAAPTTQAAPETRESLGKRLIGEMLAADAIATAACRQVAELPDRSSPEDWPEAMLVTHEELHSIVFEAVNATQAAPQPAVQQGDGELNEWEPLTEDSEERARFDRSLDIYLGDPRVAIATALEIWSKTHSGGSFSTQCAVMANEVAKLRLPTAPAAHPAAPAAQGDAEDAARWRMLPAFIEEHQIDYVRLLRDIDAARSQAKEGA